MKAALFIIFSLLFVASAFAIDGSISVTNRGANVCEFSVSFTHNGRNECQETVKFVYGSTLQLIIPDDATNIQVKIEETVYDGTTPTTKYTIFSESFPKSVRKCYRLTGKLGRKSSFTDEHC